MLLLLRRHRGERNLVVLDFAYVHYARRVTGGHLVLSCLVLSGVCLFVR